MTRAEVIGYRPERVTAIALPERARSQTVREKLAQENYDPAKIVSENEGVLRYLSDTPFRSIGQKFVKGEPLTFQEAFLGMAFVVSSTNKGIFSELKRRFQQAHELQNLDQSQLLGSAQTFLTAMAQREVTSTLTSEEVAGMVASAMMDINLRLGFKPYVLETGGMGGDKGFIVDGIKKKVINASTLSALVLSSMGIPVVKHGSYANTSAVGSTEAAEALGINIYQKSLGEIRRLFEKTGFYFSDAHIAKTIHDLSHSPFMKYETINHIIGPMTPPISKKTILNKVIGVNEGVHPSLIGSAYEILHDRGYQRVGNVAIISGLSSNFSNSIDIDNQSEIRKYMMLDEMSPYKTLIGIVQQGKYIGCFIVSPEDFGVNLNPARIQVVNGEAELLAANREALRGLSSENAKYLALNTAIGLFVVEYLGREDAVLEGELNKRYLKECFSRCMGEISSGKAATHLDKIIAASNG